MSKANFLNQLRYIEQLSKVKESKFLSETDTKKIQSLISLSCGRVLKSI
jgi:hypothetical protein